MRFLLLLLVLIIQCGAKKTNSVHKFLEWYGTKKSTPIVLWHGMGDNCCAGLNLFKKILEREIDGVYVHSIMIGDNFVTDTAYSYFGDANTQIAGVCETIAKDMRFMNGYHAIGFSQGAQLLRGVAQRCPSPPMKTLISFGGQQQGVYGIPFCPPQDFLCDKMRRLLDYGAYTWFIQDTIIQAQYWHDPLDEDTYRTRSIFLSDINNEQTIKEEYIRNLNQLENLVLVKFENDTMVTPKESEWFGFYETNSTEKILSMEETRLYKEDRIGLKKLKESGKMALISIAGDHLAIPEKFLINEIINKYLK